MTATRIAYVTDVEGNYDFFLNYVKLSDIIYIDAKDLLEFRDDNTMFVYGGMTLSFRLAEQLNQLLLFF